MIPVEIYALMLLVFRVAAVSFIVDVIRKQRVLKRYPVASMYGKEAATIASTLRKDLYRLAHVLLFINFIPIVYDILTLFGISARPDTITMIAVLYQLTFCIGTLVANFFIWKMYKNSLADVKIKE